MYYLLTKFCGSGGALRVEELIAIRPLIPAPIPRRVQRGVQGRIEEFRVALNNYYAIRPLFPLSLSLPLLLIIPSPWLHKSVQTFYLAFGGR